ncbi:MAG: glycosyl hydrolase [Gammaproteobacteria bacterium]|nr:glycosyl hydrolase [Gammaproteobacteria bacterium]
MHRPLQSCAFAASVICALLSGCSAREDERMLNAGSGDVDYRLSMTTEILLTSEAGDKIATKENVSFRVGDPRGTIVVVSPDIVKQTIVGIGSSFTESSAFVLAHLEPEARAEVMDRIYSEQGANFSLTRTPIGSTDFSVAGKYSYANVAGDRSLEHFSIAVDQDGFATSEYPGIRDESFDLMPMIKQAMAIKNQQDDGELRIVASAWTAPPWMKDINDWYLPGAPENNYQGTGGALKPEYVQTYADYIVQYLDAYRAEGVNIWGLTPVNEPHGNSGNWESMHFTPKTQNEFIKRNLGPTLRARGFGDVKVLIYDQNRDDLEHWADEIFGDRETAAYVHGAAVHWYASTFKVFEEVFERVHEKFPNFSIIHTEGTIDDLGKEAPGGIGDPERFKESGWFDNDEFWWNDNATDWAYTAEWAPNSEDHPIYTPVHRYARNIIVSLNHWMEGWIDWNVVLDKNGGPNHAGNFCGAPIMIDPETGQVYYTPVYYVLAQFSRTIRPGDKAVQADKNLVGLDDDALHASATINDDGLLSVQLLNTTKEPIEYSLQIGAQYAAVEIAANAVQTVRVRLAK